MIVWDHPYWSHFTTLSDMCLYTICTDNTLQLFLTRVRSSVITKRNNSFTRVVWYRRYWQHVATLSHVSYQDITVGHFCFLLGCCIFSLWFARELETFPTTWAVSKCHKYVSAWKARGLAAMFGLQLKRCGRARTSGFWIKRSFTRKPLTQSRYLSISHAVTQSVGQ